jgi:hypothetical protein
MSVRLVRKQDGKAYDFDDVDAAEQLIRSGEATPHAPYPVLNPEDEKVYHFQTPEDSAAAIAAGGHLENSKGHKASKMGYLEAGARRVGQGLTAGYSDELAGVFDKLFTDKTYTQGRDESRQLNDAATEKLGDTASTVLDVAGGVAPAFIPGLGWISAGAKGVAAGSGAAIARSALQGAAAGAGFSEADNFKDLAMDTALGGAVGGAAEFAAPRIAQGVRNVAQKAKEGLADAVSPGVQRALAAGAGPKDLRKPVRDGILKAGSTLDDIRAFDGGELKSVIPDAENGVRLEFDRSGATSRPDKKGLDERLSSISDVVGSQISDLYKQGNGTVADKSELYLKVFANTSNAIDDFVRHATPGTEHDVAEKAMLWLRRIRDAGDNFEELHKIKQSLVQESRFNTIKGQKNPLAKVATELYGGLNDALKEQLDDIATQSGNATLSKLNQIYHATSSYRKLLDQGIAAEERQPRMFGILKQSSATAGAMGATIGAAAFGAVGAGIGATAGQAIDQVINSTEGRLARAELGKKIAEQLGKIPRAANAARDAITSNPNLFIPLLGEQGWKAIQEMPEKVWQEQARALMPILAQAGVFEGSEYASELDGKVDGQDKFTASQRIDELVDQGKLGVSSAGLKKSALAKDGSLPEELLPQTAEQIMARVLGKHM